MKAQKKPTKPGDTNELEQVEFERQCSREDCQQLEYDAETDFCLDHEPAEHHEASDDREEGSRERGDEPSMDETLLEQLVNGESINYVSARLRQNVVIASELGTESPSGEVESEQQNAARLKSSCYEHLWDKVKKLDEELEAAAKKCGSNDIRTAWALSVYLNLVARAWLKTCADLDSVHACREIASAFENEGNEACIYYYHQAATLGYRKAYQELARLYREDKVVKPNPELAAAYRALAGSSLRQVQKGEQHA